jgi:hypothetical protein
MTAPKSTAEAPGGSDAGPSKEQEWITGDDLMHISLFLPLTLTTVATPADYDELIEEIADTNVVK